MTWLLAPMGLVLGFAVAMWSGDRALGGVVLVTFGLLSGVNWALRGWSTALGMTLLYLALFALSHPLGKAIGSWPSVIVVGALMGAACYWWSDRRSPYSAEVADRSSPGDV